VSFPTPDDDDDDDDDDKKYPTAAGVIITNAQILDNPNSKRDSRPSPIRLETRGRFPVARLRNGDVSLAVISHSDSRLASASYVSTLSSGFTSAPLRSVKKRRVARFMERLGINSALSASQRDIALDEPLVGSPQIAPPRMKSAPAVPA